MTTKFNVIDNEPTTYIRLGEWVKEFVRKRDGLARFDDAAREKRKELFVDPMNELTGKILAALDATGQISARTEFGTATINVNHYASCSDPDAFVEFVRENDAWELMERRASGLACRAFAEEHGRLPPGVRINTVRSIGVRRAS
jgi:hypothetical protein